MPSSDQRHRKNIATLLAGAFIALHGRLPSVEEAKAWADEYGKTVDLHAENIERDNSMECLHHLLAHVVDRYPLGHWIAVAAQGPGNNTQRHDDALRITQTYDILVKTSGETPGVLIRHGSRNVEACLRYTPWEGGGWQRALHALDVAFSVEHPVYFSGTGQKSRCVGIPLELMPE
jgi:hypothetical protein